MKTFPVKLWFFKHWKSFSKLAMLGSGVGYFVYNIQKMENYKHPIFGEALYILGQDELVTSVTGLPLSIDKTKDLKTIMTNHVIKASFTAKGSKGAVDVEIAGESKTQKEIESTFAEIEKSEGKTEDKRKEFEVLQQFYILGSNVLEGVDKKFKGDLGFLEKINIPKNAQFWKINYIYANVDNEKKLVLKPKGIQEENKTKSKSKPEPPKPIQTRRTLKDVYLEDQNRKIAQKKMDANLESGEKQDGKSRNPDYSKVLLILAGAGMISLVLNRKLAQKKVVGSILHNQAIMFIRRNEYVKQELGNNLRFPELMKESAYFSDARFELEALGEKGSGLFRIFGEYDEEKKDWHLQGIEMIVKDKDGTEVNRRKLF